MASFGLEKSKNMAKIDNAALKKGGFMAQKQKGFYSLRLHITAGHLDSHQLIGISKVADAFGHGYIHLTSRQAIEIPFIKVEDADAAKAMLAEYGVEPGCCGARVRTVTGCQGSAVCPSGNIDSCKVATMLDKRYFGRNLPRQVQVRRHGLPEQLPQGRRERSWHQGRQEGPAEAGCLHPLRHLLQGLQAGCHHG